MRRPPATALFWPAVALAVASVVLAAALLAWRLAGESGLPPPAPPEGTEEEAGSASLDAILQLSPFGRAAAPAAIIAPETTLALTLHGVAIAAPPGTSSAIVSYGSEPPRVYAVGEAVTDSATLEAVFGDHVVLRVNGSPETLSFPQAGAR